MLLNLNIKDLAVVEALDLDLEQGLTVLTGETGAGKSILLTALGLALGDRADAGFIRQGANRSEINLEFSLNDAPNAKSWLEEKELLDEEDICLIRRVVSLDGRSKAFINNRTASLQSLQELASHLVEIHGQHAHLKLLQPQEQRRALDEASGNQSLLNRTESIYKKWKACKEKLDEAVQANKDADAKQELLGFQIDELEQIESLDYKALSDEHFLQANMGKILQTGQSQLQAIYDDERGSANTILKQAIHSLNEIAQLAPEFSDAVSLLEEAHIQIKEASQQLRRHLEKLEVDPNRLDWLDEKLGLLHKLARKHQTNPEALQDHLKNLREELQNITQNAEAVVELQAELQTLLNEYNKTAAQLSQNRLKGAKHLQDRISDTIRELGMPQGNFLIEVAQETDKTPSPTGFDRIEFKVSANPGLPPRPLGKVASGGELSRISLAMQVAASSLKTAATLVFDEVDSGIGGSVAEIVGQKLRELGSDRQVFCVTHLHQVAALGHHHLLVEKSNLKDKTQTKVRKLTKSERPHEIARMLGGVRITQQTLAHAEEMLAHNH